MKGTHTPNNVVVMVAMMVLARLKICLAKQQFLTLDQFYI